MTRMDISALFPFEPAPEQKQAVERAAEHAVTVITGGPGVGKTFTVNAILGLWDVQGLNVVCCAPTGKAAQRMAEQTGRAASTIHRLLGYRGEGAWEHTTMEPLPVDAVVLDEASMVDVELFRALTDAIPRGARLCVVGDVDQLPSIGPGRVLYDLIESGVVPTTRLTRIFRQAEDSRIPYVARDLNTGHEPNLEGAHDVLFADADDAQLVADTVVRAVREFLPNRGFTREDIQVLCPQHGEVCGVEQLNLTLQRELNPNAGYGEDASVRVGNDYRVYEGDRVIHKRNNYHLGDGVFNGEIGLVTRVNWRGIARLPDDVQRSETGGNRVVVVNYGDREVAYTRNEAYDLQLAYAITIHSSQGSQFGAVVMPVHSCHTYMLTRPLVYTAATRAERCLLMVGERRLLGTAAGNTRGVQRRTTLQSALTAAATAG